MSAIEGVCNQAANWARDEQNGCLVGNILLTGIITFTMVVQVLELNKMHAQRKSAERWFVDKGGKF